MIKYETQKTKENLQSELLKLAKKQIIKIVGNENIETNETVKVCCVECSYKENRKIFFCDNQTNILDYFRIYEFDNSPMTTFCPKCNAKYCVKLGTDNDLIYRKLGKNGIV